MTKLDAERTELRAFTEGVRAEAARNLDLLRAIESTLAWLERLTRQCRADTEFAEHITAALGEQGSVIDPDGQIAAAMEIAQGVVEHLYLVLIDKRQCARDDHQLCEDDGIEAAYTDAVAQAADLHNALNALRWNIGEHDINAEPFTSDPALVCSTPEEIEAALRQLINE